MQNNRLGIWAIKVKVKIQNVIIELSLDVKRKNLNNF